MLNGAAGRKARQAISVQFFPQFFPILKARISTSQLPYRRETI